MADSHLLSSPPEQTQPEISHPNPFWDQQRAQWRRLHRLGLPDEQQETGEQTPSTTDLPERCR